MLKLFEYSKLFLQLSEVMQTFYQIAMPYILHTTHDQAFSLLYGVSLIGQVDFCLIIPKLLVFRKLNEYPILSEWIP